MRSATGPLVVIIGLAMTVALVLLLFVNLGMRSELEAARGELTALRAAVEAMEPGVTSDELDEQVGVLEGRIRDLLIASGTDADASPGTDEVTGTAIVERLDDILERIDALDERVDEICGNVPIC